MRQICLFNVWKFWWYNLISFHLLPLHSITQASPHPSSPTHSLWHYGKKFKYIYHFRIHQQQSRAAFMLCRYLAYTCMDGIAGWPVLCHVGCRWVYMLCLHGICVYVHGNGCDIYFIHHSFVLNICIYSNFMFYYGFPICHCTQRTCRIFIQININISFCLLLPMNWMLLFLVIWELFVYLSNNRSKFNICVYLSCHSSLVYDNI